MWGGGQGDKLRYCQDDWGQSPKCPAVPHREIGLCVGMQVETLSLGRWRQTESSEMPCSLVFLSGRPNLEFTPEDQVLEDQELKQ